MIIQKENIEQYNDSISIMEIIGYLLIFFTLLLSYDDSQIALALPYFICLFRASTWDYRNKVVPSYILVSIFLLSIIASDKTPIDALQDGFMYMGFVFILNQAAEIYIDFKYPDNNNTTLIGDGDIPIIGSIGALFSLEIGSSCMILSLLIVFAIGLILKQREIAFIPALFISILIHYIFNQNISSYIQNIY